MALKRHRHYGINLVIAYLILAVIVFPLPLPEPYGLISVGMLATALVIGQIAALRHNYGRLCEECIATMPLNPQEKADRNKALLRGYHQLYGRRARMVATSITQLVLTAVGLTAALTVGPPVSLILLEVTLLLLLVVNVTELAHRRYGPWCPYCRGGGGGGGARAEAPDPTIPQPA